MGRDYGSRSRQVGTNRILVRGGTLQVEVVWQIQKTFPGSCDRARRS